MLKKLKLGICNFEDVHFAEANAERAKELYQNFFEFIVSQFLNNGWSELCSTTSFLRKWRSFFSRPCVIQILSEKFNLSSEHVTVITSSLYFLQNFSDSLIRQDEARLLEMNDSNYPRSNLKYFIQKSWKIIDKTFQSLSSFGNLYLLQRDSNLWLVVFDFVSERFSVRLSSCRDINLSCSFPFSWLVYDHLQQLLEIRRNLGNGVTSSDQLSFDFLSSINFNACMNLVILNFIHFFCG